MTPELLVAALLALGVLLAWLRLWGAQRTGTGARGGRLLALSLLQPLLAASLYLVLFPPARMVEAGALTVLTEGATAADVARAQGLVLALPEAGAVAGATRVPDLASALRAHPGVTRVQVLGAGLVARDRDAAATVALDFDPPPLPPGIAALSLPERSVRGAGVLIAGQVAGVEKGSVELRDPAGRRVDAAALDAEGRFALQAVAMAAGPAVFGLRVLDDEGATVAEGAAPLWIEDAPAPRVLLLAGAPGPETRALRRWLADAGAAVQARIAMGGGLQLGAAALDAAALGEADLLIVDARTWTGLGEGGRARVLAAVREGLGLLLRADGPVPAAALRGLAAPDFQIAGGGGATTWTLPSARLADEPALRARIGGGTRDAPFDLEQAQAAVPAINRRNWRLRGDGGIAFDEGAGEGDVPAGWWRPEGRGRIGLWTLLDSYVLPLHGRMDLFDGLWSPALATLARARADALPPVPADGRAGERLVVCDWPEGAVVEAPDGAVLTPLADPRSGTARCAGLWPQVPGWHRLRLDGAERGFHVAGAETGPVARLAALRERTQALAMSPPRPAAAAVSMLPSRRGPAWPWFLGWLALAGLAWWLERAWRGAHDRS
jgi:hypothetical protein